MKRSLAIIFSLILFLIFTMICYYGANITLFSSIIFSLFSSIILLNILYPISNNNNEEADFWLIIYITYQILTLIILAIYLISKTLLDIRLK